VSLILAAPRCPYATRTPAALLHYDQPTDCERCSPHAKEIVMPRVPLDQTAPEFRLPDFSGVPVSLSDYRGEKNVLLVFNRGFT
jgi:hypothetical protein